MSSPFGGAKPAIVPFSATTDSNGNATIRLQPRLAFWWAGKAVGKVSGGVPVWEATMGGIFSGVGRGQRAEIAGLLVAPGDVLQLSVSGAAPSAAVTGSLVGLQGPTMEDVVVAFSPNPNTVAVDIFNRVTLLGTIANAGNGDTVTATFPLSPSTQGVGFMVRNRASLGDAFPQSLSMTGVQTGFQYVNVQAPVSTANEAVNPADTQVLCSVLGNATPGSTSFTYFYAYNYNPVTRIENRPGTLLNLFLSSPTTLTAIYAAVERGTLPSLGVTMSQANPAPWQAPGLLPIDISATIAASGQTNPIAAAVGKSVYLHSMQLTLDAVGAAGSDLRFFDGDPSGAGVDRGRIGTNVQPPPIDFKGVKLTTGNGFFLFNGGGAGITIRGTLTASQA